MKPEFIGKVLLVENYDLALARKLVAGVDVWLNNPEYPLEASGTSGMKAAINGGDQSVGARRLVGRRVRRYERLGHQAARRRLGQRLSISRRRTRPDRLARKPRDSVVFRLRIVARMDSQWPKPRCARSFRASTRERMVREYVENLYCPRRARIGHWRLDRGAERLAEWKQRVARTVARRAARRESTLRRSQVAHGDTVVIDLRAQLAGLQPSDVRVECVVSSERTSRR